MIDAFRRILAAQLEPLPWNSRGPLAATIDELFLEVEGLGAQPALPMGLSGFVSVSASSWRVVAEAVGDGVLPDDHAGVAYAVRDLAAMNAAQAETIGGFRTLLAYPSDPLESLRALADDERRQGRLLADLRDELLGGADGDLVQAAHNTVGAFEKSNEINEVVRMLCGAVESATDSLTTVALVASVVTEGQQAIQERDRLGGELSKIRVALGVHHDPFGEEMLAESAARVVRSLDRAERDRDDLRTALDAVRAALPDGDSVEDLAETVRALVEVALQTSAVVEPVVPMPAAEGGQPMVEPIEPPPVIDEPAATIVLATGAKVDDPEPAGISPNIVEAIKAKPALTRQAIESFIRVGSYGYLGNAAKILGIGKQKREAKEFAEWIAAVGNEARPLQGPAREKAIEKALAGVGVR